MANDEHVAILKKGMDAWNRWREENPDIRPDLSEADLKGANLKGADLREANLRQARLGEANLRGISIGCFRCTDTRSLSSCSQHSRRRLFPLPKER
jgi:hypothetical protein